MKRALVLLAALVTLSFMFVSDINADVGPKPSLEITVKNPPESEYYLDLLVDYSSDYLYDNIRDTEGYSGKRYDVLKGYNADGWRPALVTGTRVPLRGKLTGEKNGDNMVHNFSYVGVPDRFKVIIVTSDNEVIVSENIVDRKAFNSKVYFDCSTKRLWESSALLSYALQFLSTCSLTLIIEGLILILFRFSMKQNWRTFLLVNIITQVLLTIVVFGAMHFYGLLLGILAYAAFEWVILIVEAILFAKYLSQHSKRRRIMFAITANIASFLLGLILMMSTII